MAFYEVLQTLHILQRNICKISNTSKTRNQSQKSMSYKSYRVRNVIKSYKVRNVI